MEFLKKLIEDPGSMMLLLTGIVMLIIFYFVSRFPPKKINDYYGYRTKRSMKNQETWDYAQEYSNKLFYKATIAMILLGILMGFINWNDGFSIFVSLVLLFGLIYMPIYYTEKKLKSRFK